MQDTRNPQFALLLLHGLGMYPEVLESFGRSLGLPAEVRAPSGPIEMPDGSRAWWCVDPENRRQQFASGPRDLFDRYPPDRPAARQALSAEIEDLHRRWPGLPVILIGFSQGGMLAMDYLLLESVRGIAACALLSSTRIAANDWEPRLSNLRGLPVFVAHGSRDDQLPFSAGEQLRDLALRAGARVQWMPFDGGHEMPLVVWRRLRQFLLNVQFPTVEGSESP